MLLPGRIGLKLIGTDGCPNQFDYGTNYHQTAEWRVKTAQWALDDAKAKRAEAEAALGAATEALEAASEEAQAAAAATLEAAQAVSLKVVAETKATIESDGLSNAIIRAHTKLIEYHRKAGYDSLGYMPKLAVSEAIESEALLDPGTRDLVIYLAKHKPSPSVAKADKSGWEVPGRYIYAFYDTAKFTRFAVPDACVCKSRTVCTPAACALAACALPAACATRRTSFKGGQDHHRFIGLCEDRRKAEKDRPLRVAKLFCACHPCLLLKTEECLLPQVVGKAVRAQAPLKIGVPVRGPQMVSLEAFSDSLDAKMLVAICADESEVDVEGPYCGSRCSVGRHLCSTRTHGIPASSTARDGSSRQDSGTGFASAASGATSCCRKRCAAAACVRTLRVCWRARFTCMLGIMHAFWHIMSGAARGQSHDLPQGPQLWVVPVGSARAYPAPRPWRPGGCGPGQGLRSILFSPRTPTT